MARGSFARSIGSSWDDQLKGYSPHDWQAHHDFDDSEHLAHCHAIVASVLTPDPAGRCSTLESLDSEHILYTTAGYWEVGGRPNKSMEVGVKAKVGVLVKPNHVQTTKETWVGLKIGHPPNWLVSFWCPFPPTLFWGTQKKSKPWRCLAKTNPF